MFNLTEAQLDGKVTDADEAERYVKSRWQRLKAKKKDSVNPAG